MNNQDHIEKMMRKAEVIMAAGNEEKAYAVTMRRTYVFSFVVRGKNRVEAEQKAKEFVEEYKKDKFFACNADSFEKEVYKIIPKV